MDESEDRKWARRLSARLQEAIRPDGSIDLNAAEEVLAACRDQGFVPCVIDPKSETIEPVEG